ncbi:hypothetical protein [Orrella marina]|uniref:Lytic murein transglycosylase n=1 Tax=Orrella marina TaxID=2163011 RepID=A0A2R4XL69_9BURK|nr:hypothetical protein [Orrella marina]AWB34557.1 hypothetical protein DBV39_13485 [Orrella marina]
MVSSLLLSPAQAQGTSSGFQYDIDTPQARAVAQAREAVRQGQWGRLPSLADQAQGDVLGIYADFWVAQGAIKQALSTQQIPVAQAFLERYPGSYMADRVRAEWVLAAAEHGDFKTIQEIGEFIWYNNQVRCAKIESRHMTGKRATAEEAVRDFAPGQTCWSMMAQLVADGVLTRRQLTPMMLDALEINHTRTAERIASHIFDRAALQTYKNMMANPGRWVRAQKGRLTGDDALIAAMGLARMARDDLSGTAAYVGKSWQNRLPPELLAWVRVQIAFRDALNLEMTRADHLYRQAGNIELSPSNYEWRVRAALRQPVIDWKWVQTAIDWMPPALRSDNTWQYWKARALAAQGDQQAANQIYASIAKDLDFYGQLALEELGRPILIPVPPPRSQRRSCSRPGAIHTCNRPSPYSDRVGARKLFPSGITGCEG